MPDHLLTYPPLERVTWRAHLAAHPESTVLAGLVWIGGAALIVDAAARQVLLPTLANIPWWVQSILGAALMIGAALVVLGMTWRPQVTERDGKLHARIDDPIALERFGWIAIAITSLALAVAIARVGPWVIAVALPASCAVQATARALWLTWFARRRRETLAGDGR